MEAGQKVSSTSRLSSVSIDIDLYSIQSPGHLEERDLEFGTQGHNGY